MPNAQPAIKRYHALIEEDLAAAEAQIDLLRQLQVDRRLLFGERPMAYSLRPTFLTDAGYASIQDTVYTLRQAIYRVSHAYFNDPVALAEVGMQEWEIELAALPTRVARFSVMARMDAFMTQDSFKFVEVNGESPAGMAYVHGLGQVYRALPLFQRFIRQNPVRFVSPLEHMVFGQVRVYHEHFEGKEEKPAFAIVDHLDVPTYPEFVLIQNYLERHGYPCEIIDPRRLECRDGWIYANDRKIDILYRRLLMNEFYAMRDECGAYLEGYKAQKTCYLNSFRDKFVHKKAIFALLTDPRYTHVLTPQQLQTIRDHIPWTRKLRPQKTGLRGLNIDLLEFVRANRQYFVIKPNDEYGGKGVTLGFAASESEWQTALDEGIQGDFVVQETVDIHREPFLINTSGAWEYVPTVIDLDPYLNGPFMGGCLTRTSATNLANVTAGGGTLPLFILRDDV